MNKYRVGAQRGAAEHRFAVWLGCFRGQSQQAEEGSLGIPFKTQLVKIGAEIFSFLSSVSGTHISHPQTLLDNPGLHLFSK